MFNHGPFDNQIIRKHAIVLGTMLNQIFIQRKDENGVITSVVRLPIAYGPKDKAIARVLSDPDLTRPFGSILPFMTFDLVRMTYRNEDQLPKVGRFLDNVSGTNKDVATWLRSPTPYDFEFEATIMVKNVSDGWNIIEQIAAWFSPDWTVTVKLLTDPHISLDIKTLLAPIDMKDNWSEGNIEDTRYISWVLTFVMQGYIFGPIIKSKLIKEVDINFGETAGEPVVSVTITPGLDANGSPTSDSSITIPWSQIGWDDDYGEIEEITG